jgi:hypothetical protein
VGSAVVTETATTAPRATATEDAVGGVSTLPGTGAGGDESNGSWLGPAAAILAGAGAMLGVKRLGRAPEAPRQDQ